MITLVSENDGLHYRQYQLSISRAKGTYNKLQIHEKKKWMRLIGTTSAKQRVWFLELLRSCMNLESI